MRRVATPEAFGGVHQRVVGEARAVVGDLDRDRARRSERFAAERSRRCGRSRSRCARRRATRARASRDWLGRAPRPARPRAPSSRAWRPRDSRACRDRAPARWRRVFAAGGRRLRREPPRAVRRSTPPSAPTRARWTSMQRDTHRSCARGATRARSRRAARRAAREARATRPRRNAARARTPTAIGPACGRTTRKGLRARPCHPLASGREKSLPSMRSASDAMSPTGAKTRPPPAATRRCRAQIKSRPTAIETIAALRSNSSIHVARCQTVIAPKVRLPRVTVTLAVCRPLRAAPAGSGSPAICVPAASYTANGVSA